MTPPYAIYVFEPKELVGVKPSFEDADCFMQIRTVKIGKPHLIEEISEEEAIKLTQSHK